MKDFLITYELVIKMSCYISFTDFSLYLSKLTETIGLSYVTDQVSHTQHKSKLDTYIFQSAIINFNTESMKVKDSIARLYYKILCEFIIWSNQLNLKRRSTTKSDRFSNSSKSNLLLVTGWKIFSDIKITE